MNVVTHALLPVAVVCTYQRLISKSTPLTNIQIVFVGILGAAPDLLNPHLSLQSRYESWSHSFPVWFVIIIAVLIISMTARQRVSLKAAIWMSLAYFIHLICDIIAGGIAWLRPFSDEIIGAYYVSAKFWIPLDIFFVVATYILFRKELMCLFKKNDTRK